MEVIEKAVRLGEAVKVFDIIEQVLREQIDTQVFVDNDLYAELIWCGSKDHVYLENFNSPSSSHYPNDNPNCYEIWLNHTVGCASDTTIHKASFINNCTNYMQLVQFEAEGLGYTHFEQDLKQFLLIEVEK